MDARIHVRLRDRPDALERVMGLLRRRAFAVRRVSLALGEDDTLELVLRIDEPTARAERARQELLTLVDVLEARPADAPGAADTRELLIARLPGPAPDAALAAGRARTDADGTTVLEVAGAPDELDEIVSRLEDSGVPFRFVRSGEITVPRPPDTRPERNGDHE